MVQCKTVLIPGLHVLVHPNQTQTFPQQNSNKCPKNAQKMRGACVTSSNLHFFQILQDFLLLFELTSETEVTKCSNQSIAVLLNIIVSSHFG